MTKVDALPLLPSAAFGAGCWSVPPRRCCCEAACDCAHFSSRSHGRLLRWGTDPPNPTPLSHPTFLAVSLSSPSGQGLRPWIARGATTDDRHERGCQDSDEPCPPSGPVNRSNYRRQRCFLDGSRIRAGFSLGATWLPSDVRGQRRGEEGEGGFIDGVRSHFPSSFFDAFPISINPGAMTSRPPAWPLSAFADGARQGRRSPSLRRSFHVGAALGPERSSRPPEATAGSVMRCAARILRAKLALSPAPSASERQKLAERALPLRRVASAGQPLSKERGLT